MIEIDKTQTDKLFESLSPENRHKFLNKALLEGAKILQTATKQKLISTGVESRSLQRGIKIKKDNSYQEISVHIMGDFRLKFFENGTKERMTKKTKRYTGRITSRKFFYNARQSSEEEINNAVIQSLDESFKKLDRE